MDPDSVPISLYILYTYMTVAGQTGCRAYLYGDQTTAHAEGEKQKATKPAEASAFGYMVLPLEGAPT